MGRLEIKSWDEVPEFENEAQEAKFWAMHYLSEALAEEAQAVDPITFGPLWASSVCLTYFANPVRVKWPLVYTVFRHLP